MKHMDISEKKKEGAMRIFEALELVDEELLERSEQERPKMGSRKKQKNSPGRIFHRGAAPRLVMAAACFTVLGVLAFGVSRVYFSTEGTAQLQLSSEADNVRNTLEAAPGEGAMSGGSAGSPSQDTGSSVAQDSVARDSVGISESDSAPAAHNILELSETDARALTDFGSYVPDCIPERFAFFTASAELAEDGMAESLFIGFADGLDYIEFVICRGDEKAAGNPILRKEELTLELISERIQKNNTDIGDTAGPRGNFTVYFEEENILVEYRGRAETEEVLEMFESIPVEEH